jgi:hypothetical protein
MLMIVARCDKCGTEIVRIGHTTKSDMIRSIRAKGWSVSKGSKLVPEKTYCPYCRK